MKLKPILRNAIYGIIEQSRSVGVFHSEIVSKLSEFPAVEIHTQIQELLDEKDSPIEVYGGVKQFGDDIVSPTGYRDKMWQVTKYPSYRGAHITELTPEHTLAFLIEQEAIKHHDYTTIRCNVSMNMLTTDFNKVEYELEGFEAYSDKRIYFMVTDESGRYVESKALKPDF